MYIFVFEKQLDSIFEARNICFELGKVGLLKYSNEKHALEFKRRMENFGVKSAMARGQKSKRIIPDCAESLVFENLSLERVTAFTSFRINYLMERSLI